MTEPDFDNAAKLWIERYLEAQKLEITKGFRNSKPWLLQAIRQGFEFKISGSFLCLSYPDGPNISSWHYFRSFREMELFVDGWRAKSRRISLDEAKAVIGKEIQKRSRQTSDE